MAQKLTSGPTRAQRCHGIKVATDGKSVFEAHGDAVVVRSAKTGEVVQYLRTLTKPKDPNQNAAAEAIRLKMRDAELRAHFDKVYKKPEGCDATHKSRWVVRQVAKYAIPEDHLSHVTSFAPHPTSTNLLLVATADHLLRIWDVSTGAVVETFTLDAPAVWMAASTVDPSLVVIVLNDTPRMERKLAFRLSHKQVHEGKRAAWTVNLHDLETTSWHMVAFNLTKGTIEQAICEGHHRPFFGAALQQRMSPKSPFVNAVAAIADHKLFVARIGVKNTGDEAPRNVVVSTFKHERRFTCVAMHPTKDEAVTGDSSGRMQVWHDLDSEAAVAPSKLHWHAHAVGCLAYSVDGTYVVSGGEEFVLVLWHLESGRRQHVPRLSAQLTSIAVRPDGAGYLVAGHDNSVLYYNHVTATHVWHACGLSRVGLSSAKTLINGRMALEPWANTLALQGTSLIGNVQLYHPLQDRVLSTVALTERNQVSRTFNEAPTRTYATQIAFSPATRTMATVTVTEGESALRFWTRKGDGSFAVNTDVDAPHGPDHTVTAMAAHDKLVVTADDQGEFRVWARGDGGVWGCQSLSQYRRASVGAVAFSDDGSLLAVAYGPLVTLWDPATNALRSVLAYPKDDVLDVAFTGASSPFLVARTASGVYVWSLLTLSIHWFYSLPVTTMSVLKGGESQLLLGVTTRQNKKLVGHLFVFALSSPTPTAIYRLPGVSIADACFYQGHILVMDTKSTVHAVGDAMLVSATPATLHEESQSIMQQLYGSWTTPEAAKTEAKADGKSADGIFQAPVHVLPPLRSLYRSFLDAMLTKSKELEVAATTSSKHVRRDEAVVPVAKRAKVQEEAPEDTYAALKRVFSHK
ncbi:hypothetical protein ACHHYP_12857 [Achlya hypogyna]|uniref:WD repeat-containing protein 75 second beta-propeller domain-containing protein n=1 Tax=Achlya hypogyna TaxID=1202772 RepID=A0A1V9ZG63_ACHHY|nr:hypothetical protein ACHHYP_12857 [Achlya hypogyna]